MANIQSYLNEWQRSKEFVDGYIKDFKRLDTIANAQYDGSNNKNPNVGDTTIAGIVRQIMRTAVKQLPVISTAINGSKGTAEAITCRHLVNDRILDPASFGKGFVNIIHLGGRGALTRGFNVFQATGTKMYGQYGVAPRIVHYNDFGVEPGVQDGNHSGYFWIRTKFTPSKLRRIYEAEKNKPATTWNLKALRALLDIGPDGNGTTDYSNFLTPTQQPESSINSETYDLLTRYSINSDVPIITISERINEELRTMPNKSKFGYPRVLFLVIDPAELSPFGDSRVRLASPNQNFLMALRQNVATTWLYNSKPMLVRTGMFTGAKEIKSGGVMDSIDANSKASFLTLDTATSQQYPEISQEVTKQIQTMMGMNPGQSLGAIGDSKTGVGAQTQKQGIDDAIQQVSSIIEELIRQYITTGLDMLLSENSGEEVIYVDDETREDILRVNPEAFPDPAEPNGLRIVWEELYEKVKKIDIVVDTKINKEDWTDEKRKDLQDTLVTMSQTSDPADPNARARIKEVEDKFLDETSPELSKKLRDVSTLPTTPVTAPETLTAPTQ